MDLSRDLKAALGRQALLDKLARALERCRALGDVAYEPPDPQVIEWLRSSPGWDYPEAREVLDLWRKECLMNAGEDLARELRLADFGEIVGRLTLAELEWLLAPTQEAELKVPCSCHGSIECHCSSHERSMLGLETFPEYEEEYVRRYDELLSRREEILSRRAAEEERRSHWQRKET